MATASTVVSATEPQTCDQAAAAHSYIGCDYWPTVVANNVWSIFDFAVVVANVGLSTATVTVTGTGANLSRTNQMATVMPGQLATIYLPWVPELKGPDTDTCGVATPLSASVLQTGGAYHLVSSVPVTVYQFNALEYQGAGGPTGKVWSDVPWWDGSARRRDELGRHRLLLLFERRVAPSPEHCDDRQLPGHRPRRVRPRQRGDGASGRAVHRDHRHARRHDGEGPTVSDDRAQILAGPGGSNILATDAGQTSSRCRSTPGTSRSWSRREAWI